MSEVPKPESQPTPEWNENYALSVREEVTKTVYEQFTFESPFQALAISPDPENEGAISIIQCLAGPLEDRFKYLPESCLTLIHEDSDADIDYDGNRFSAVTVTICNRYNPDQASVYLYRQSDPFANGPLTESGTLADTFILRCLAATRFTDLSQEVLGEYMQTYFQASTNDEI